MRARQSGRVSSPAESPAKDEPPATRMKGMEKLTAIFVHAARLALIGVLFSMVACSRPDSPEHRIRALIAAAEQAIEKREVGEVRGYISENYRDEDARDRRAIDGLLRLYVLRQQTIHLLTVIDSVETPQAGRGEAVVYVAMAGRPIASAAELAALRADLFRFELGFKEEDGDWRVVRAAWRRADLADFVYQN